MSFSLLILLIYFFCSDGLYLIEVDRILRPGGYWILSGPPINWENHWKGWNRTADDLNAEQSLVETVAKSLCWKLIVKKNDLAIWQKPTNHIHCKAKRKVFKHPRFCQTQNPDTAWWVLSLHARNGFEFFLISSRISSVLKIPSYLGLGSIRNSYFL